MFLVQTPGLCSEELLLPESVGEEKVQSFPQMKIKGSVQMVLTGVRTWRVALLNGGKEQLVQMTLSREGGTENLSHFVPLILTLCFG